MPDSALESPAPATSTYPWTPRSSHHLPMPLVPLPPMVGLSLPMRRQALRAMPEWLAEMAARRARWTAPEPMARRRPPRRPAAVGVWSVDATRVRLGSGRCSSLASWRCGEVSEHAADGLIGTEGRQQAGLFHPRKTVGVAPLADCNPRRRLPLYSRPNANPSDGCPCPRFCCSLRRPGRRS